MTYAASLSLVDDVSGEEICGMLLAASVRRMQMKWGSGWSNELDSIAIKMLDARDLHARKDVFARDSRPGDCPGRRRWAAEMY